MMEKLTSFLTACCLVVSFSFSSHAQTLNPTMRSGNASNLQHSTPIVSPDIGLTTVSPKSGIRMNHSVTQETSIPQTASRLSANQVKGVVAKVPAAANVADSILLYGLHTPGSGYTQLSSLQPHVFSFHMCPSLDYTDESKADIPEPMTAFYAKGKFYCIYSSLGDNSYVTSYMDVYDAKTWEKLESQIDISGDHSMDYLFRSVSTYDPYTGKAYSVTWGKNYDKPLVSIDLNTYKVNPIGLVNKHIITLFVGKDKELYGIDYAPNGELFKINKTSGSAEVIGKIAPYNLTNLQNGTVTDPVTGKTYWVAVKNGSYASALYSFMAPDLNLTKICDMPQNERFTGMYIPYVDSTAAAAPSNIRFEYDSEGGTSGYLKFTVPTTTYLSDENLSGTLKAVVSLDSVEQVIDVTPGEEVSRQMNLEMGLHTFVIFIRNSAGDGAARRLTTFAGIDVPGPVVNLTATKSGNNISLSWGAPTGSLHGGPYDDNVTYRVVRYPDETVVADQLTDSSYTDQLPEARHHYYYKVISLSGDREGGVAVTDEFPGGSVYVPPFTESFELQEDYDLFSQIDANGDGNTWKYMSLAECAYLMGAGDGHNDDYLVTAPIAMSNEVDYELVMHNMNLTTPEHMRLLLGKNKELQGNEIAIDDDVTVQTGDTEYKQVFNVAENGNYYLFFHDNTQTYSMNNEIADFSIKIFAFFNAPDSVTELKAIAGDKGALTNRLTFRAPTRTYHGQTLENITRIDIFKNGSEEPVASIDNVSVGESVVWDDPNPTQGVNEYEILPFNEVGQGRAAYISNFVGVDVPMAPVALTAKMNTDNYDPSFTWESSGSVGAHGGYVDESKVKYVVCVYSPQFVDNPWQAISDSITEKSFTYDAYFNHGTQEYLEFAVRACNEIGYSDAVVGITLGPPYELPYIESFAGGDINYLPWTRYAESSNYAWNVSTGSGMSIRPYDNDGGMFTFTYKDVNSNREVIQGPRISILGTAKPELSYFMYHLNSATKCIVCC